MAYTTGQIREADPDTVRVDPERRELVFVISVVGRSVTCRLDGQVLQHETGSRDPDAWEAWARANIRSLNAAFGQKLSQPWGQPNGESLTISANEWWAMYRPNSLRT